MKRGGKTIICLLGGIALAMGAKAITGNPTSMPHPDAAPATAAPATPNNTAGDGANPYETIVSRNVFDLREPVVKPETNAPVAPPANVKLTGIMSVFGVKQALFMVQKGVVQGKQPEQPISYILSEGQRQEGLEVLEIDQPNKKVKIKNDGIVSTISFEVAKTPAGHQDMTPGQPHMGRAGGFTPNLNMGPNGGPAMPERTVRMPNAASYNPQQNGANPGYNPAQNNGYLGGGYNVGNQGQQQPPATPEEQIANLLANQQVNSRLPPLPPLPGVPSLQNNQGEQQQQQQQQQPTTGPQFPPIPGLGPTRTGTLK